MEATLRLPTVPLGKKLWLPSPVSSKEIMSNIWLLNRPMERIGVAGAELTTLGGAFAPKKTLHISVVYVVPLLRRGGIGGRLIAKLLEWGRAAGCELCDLNVLSGNPARSLYERCGFSASEVKMVRSLV